MRHSERGTSISVTVYFGVARSNLPNGRADWWLEPSSPKFGLNPTSMNHGVRLEYPRIPSRKIYCPLLADDRFERGSPAFASKRPTWKVSDRIGTMNQSTEAPRGHSHVYWRRQLDSSFCGLHREWVHMCVFGLSLPIFHCQLRRCQ